jgi:condensin-2 complex subunit G2
MDHSSDSSSAVVRAAAIEAFITLLGSNQTHAVVRNLLPALGNLIHDKSEKVRLATVKMLLCVKRAPGIRFYHVVPADQLSARFVAEAAIHRNPRNPVARELTALMLNSFFPNGSNVSTSKQLKRTVTYLLTDPVAASVFYANLADHLEVDSVVKLILLLYSCLKSAVEVEQAAQLRDSLKQKKRRRRPSTEETVDTEDIDKLSASNTTLMASLAATIDVLWESIIDHLNTGANKDSKSMLQETVLAENCMTTVLSHFEQKGIENSSRTDEAEISCRSSSFSTCVSMMACASRLDTKATGEIANFVSHSMESMTTGTPDESTVYLLCSYLAFLCQTQEGTEEVATLLSKSIEKSVLGEAADFLAATMDGSDSRRRRSSLRSATAKSAGVDSELDPRIAWNVLEHVMQGASSEGRTIRDALIVSDDATSRLQKAFLKGIHFVERLLGSDLGETFEHDQIENGLRACEMYGRFALHKQSSCVKGEEDEATFNRQLEILINWTTEKVLPALLRSSGEGESELRDLDLSLISPSRESMTTPGSPSHSPPKQKANSGRTPESIRGSSLHLDVYRSENDPAVTYAAKVAQTLLANSCRIAAELVAMGTENNSISEASRGWCKVLDRDQQTDSLYRSVLVLAVTQTACNSCELLVEVLARYDSESGFGDMVEKAITFLARSRPNVLFEVFISLADRKYECPQNSSFDASAQVEDVCAGVGGALEIFWDTIVSHTSMIHPFANSLARHIRDESQNTSHQSGSVAFKINCLYLLVSKINNTTSLVQALDDLDPDLFKEGAPRDGMRAILQAVSATA